MTETPRKNEGKPASGIDNATLNRYDTDKRERGYMKKLAFLMAAVLLLFPACARHAVNHEQILSGKYICDSDYHKDDFFKEYPESTPYILFRKNGTCEVFVNYLEGGCIMQGVYAEAGKEIVVNLDFAGTIFEGTGTEYMDDRYTFTVIHEDKMVIDKGFYTVAPGDAFVKTDG